MTEEKLKIGVIISTLLIAMSAFTITQVIRYHPEYSEGAMDLIKGDPTLFKIYLLLFCVLLGTVIGSIMWTFDITIRPASKEAENAEEDK